jgi:hypothetical protein
MDHLTGRSALNQQAQHLQFEGGEPERRSRGAEPLLPADAYSRTIDLAASTPMKQTAASRLDRLAVWPEARVVGRARCSLHTDRAG